MKKSVITNRIINAVRLVNDNDFDVSGLKTYLEQNPTTTITKVIAMLHWTFSFHGGYLIYDGRRQVKEELSMYIEVFEIEIPRI